jgi:hypothetical protein
VRQTLLVHANLAEESSVQLEPARTRHGHLYPGGDQISIGKDEPRLVTVVVSLVVIGLGGSVIVSRMVIGLGGSVIVSRMVIGLGGSVIVSLVARRLGILV